jgi:hypothetical protein
MASWTLELENPAALVERAVIGYTAAQAVIILMHIIPAAPPN